MHAVQILSSVLLSLVVGTAIGAEEPGRPPAVGELIEVLRKKDFVARQKALDALEAQPEAAPEYAPELRRALKDEDAAVRQQAAMALAAFGVGEQEVVDELVAGMARRHPGRYHSQPEDARGAMSGMVKLGAKAVPALVKALQDEKYAGRSLAVAALARIGPPAKDAVPTLAKALENRDDPAWPQLVDAKWRIDGDAAAALERLVPLLDNDERGRRCGGAVHVLASMGVAGKGAVPALIVALDRYQEPSVLWALRELAPHAKDLAIPALREAMDKPRLADNAAIALQGLGIPAEEIVPHQLRRLADCKQGDGSDPMRIVYTIAICFPESKPYAPDLIGLLQHANPSVRRAAAWGVSRVGGELAAVEAALEKALGDAEVKEDAVRSLKMLRDAR